MSDTDMRYSLQPCCDEAKHRCRVYASGWPPDDPPPPEVWIDTFLEGELMGATFCPFCGVHFLIIDAHAT